MPTALQASISSVPAGAVTCLPSTVMVTFLTSAMVYFKIQSVSDFLDLRRVPFGVHGHRNQHFTNADHPGSGMRVLYFAGAQIVRVLFKELDHTGTRGFKLLRGLSQRGKAADWPCALPAIPSCVCGSESSAGNAYSRFGASAATRSALRTDQLELYGLSGRQMLNRIQHATSGREQASTGSVLQ